MSDAVPDSEDEGSPRIVWHRPVCMKCAISDKHKPCVGNRYCHECGGLWPCSPEAARDWANGVFP